MSSPTNINERDDMLVAEYALGTLPHGERVALDARFASEPPLARRLVWWNEQLIPMSGDIVPVPAPASVLKGIENRLFGDGSKKASWWHSLGFWRGLAVASVFGTAVFAGLFVNNILKISGQETSTYVAQVAGETSDVKLAALYDAASKTLRLNRIAGKAAINRTLELWVIAGDNAPVSLGVLPIEANFEIAVPGHLQAALAEGAILAVSDEPTGGSPTGQPTGAVLATGKTIPI